MTLSTHVAIGAAIGVLVGQPVLGFALGLVSHFLVDMIPHGDTVLADRFFVHKDKMVPMIYTGVDIVLSLLLVALMVAIKPEHVGNGTLLAAVAGSVFPDALVGIAKLWKTNTLLKAYDKFHFYFHDFFSRPYGDVSLRLALAAQAVFIIIVIKLISQIL
jgi:hypothetical protein